MGDSEGHGPIQPPAEGREEALSGKAKEASLDRLSKKRKCSFHEHMEQTRHIHQWFSELYKVYFWLI